jgi:hypothetical protein
MAPGRETLVSWRTRIAALRAPVCNMAHEAVRFGPDGKPVANPRSPSGYARSGVCTEAVRAGHLGCNHTTARYLLRDALESCPHDGNAELLAELNDLENAISLLDHRRYDAETRYAQAVAQSARADIAESQRAIGALEAEHRGYIARVLAVRAVVLVRLDAAIGTQQADAMAG